MRNLKQRGDTIVEVLIATLVISTVLAGAFVSAQRSLTVTRRSQERVEALKVAEQQTEHLKELATSKPGDIFSPARNKFCIDTAGNATPPSTDITAIQPVSSEDFSNTNLHPASCTVKPAGTIAYYPAIDRNPSGGNTFKIYVHWERAGGDGIEELTIAYRVYP